MIRVVLLVALTLPATAFAGEPIPLWPGLAPGETTKKTGTQQPFRPNENPPVVRVVDITCPTLTFYPSPNPNGSAVVVLPGGGFGKVVTNKEGSEYAKILNEEGIGAFVVSYRTKSKTDKNGWVKPLQDAQRAMALVRARAKDWNLDPTKIGLTGFSAGGNVAARLLCGSTKKAYETVDELDKNSHRPDFALLVYPWRIYDAKTGGLAEGMKVPENCPPTFLLHTDDDTATSLGSVRFYAELKLQKIPAALHVYSNGGHGYGTRPVNGSQIGGWPALARSWLKTLELSSR